MKIFKFPKKIQAVAEWQKTASGFRHVATLFRNDIEIGKDKAVYYNRTWERYEYETVLMDLIEKNDVLTDAEKKACMKKIKVGFR